MAKGDPRKIDVPKGSKPDTASDSSVVIHVMPKEFYGKEATTAREAQKPLPPPPPAPAPIAPPPPVVKPLPAPPVAPKKKSNRLTKILLIGGLLFVLLLAIAAYFYVQSLQPTTTETPVTEQPSTPVVEQPTPEPAPVVITRGVDSDSDGLTDREEVLYGTDPRNPDSDGDSFLDGNEVFHRFDPNGFAPSTLLDTGAVVEYIDANYRLTYPRSWAFSTDAEANIALRSATGTTISVKQYTLAGEQTFLDWYGTEITGKPATVLDFQQSVSKEGYAVYMTVDELRAYVLADGKVFEFIYDLGDSTTIDYLQTFQMIVNSFVYQPTS